MVLKLTFVNGETHVFPFDSTSTLSVTTRTGDAASGVIESTLSWSEIVGLELADEQVADAPTVVEAAPPAPPTAQPEPVAAEQTLASPAAAVEHAATLPLPDAAAHLEAALLKFPDDPDLVAAKADIDEQLQA